MERLVKFEVLGHEYPFYTDAPAEDVEEILNLIRSQIEDHSQDTKKILPVNKIAVLVSLNMAGKYVSLKREFEQYRQEMENYVERLSTKIESSLPRQEKNKEENLAV